MFFNSHSWISGYPHILGTTDLDIAILRISCALETPPIVGPTVRSFSHKRSYLLQSGKILNRESRCAQKRTAPRSSAQSASLRMMWLVSAPRLLHVALPRHRALSKHRTTRHLYHMTTDLVQRGLMISVIGAYLFGVFRDSIDVLQQNVYLNF